MQDTNHIPEISTRRFNQTHIASRKDIDGRLETFHAQDSSKFSPVQVCIQSNDWNSINDNIDFFTSTEPGLLSFRSKV